MAFLSRTFCVILSSILLASSAVAQFDVPVAVGINAAPQPVTLVLPQGGTIDQVHILTGGIENSDFSLVSAGTCVAGSTFGRNGSCTLSVGFKPSAPGQRVGAVVLLDRDRAIIAQRFVPAQGRGPVLTFLPGTIDTIAGNQAWIYGGDSVPATQASIFLPFGIAVDSAGNLYIADSANNRIRRVDSVTGMITTVAGTGTVGYSADGGSAVTATLSNPTGLALDAAGNLFFSDSGNNVIRRIDAFTGRMTTVVTHLSHPNGIAISPANQLYIADTGNHVIRRVDLTSGAIVIVAGNGSPGFSGDGGPGPLASLSSPWSVSLAPSGDVLVADQNNHRIRSVSAGSQIISTIAGTGQPGFSGDAGPASAAQLNVPASVAFDVAGNLYIADSGNNRVRKISALDGTITTIAGNSGESISGDSGRADQAGLYGPYTLAVDSGGSLLIADVFHNRVRKVSANVATLDYPPMRVGRISTALPETIENDGNAPLNITAFSPAAHSQMETGSATTCNSDAMLPGAHCVASVQFAPVITGDPVQGQIKVISNATNSPGIMTLRGKVLNVDPATVILASGLNPATTGDMVAFTVTVSSDGATPTGAISLTEGSTILATTNLLPGGTATFSISNLAGGNHNLTASYAGDSSNSSALSTPLLQVVKDRQAPTSTSITSSANVIDAGASLRVVALVTADNPAAASGALSGSVAFKEGLNTLGVANVVNGEALLVLSNLAVGTHRIIAAYNGTSNYAPSVSDALAQTVTIATSRLALSTSANPGLAGVPMTLTANAASTGGFPGGSVAFFDGNAPLGSATLDPQGLASLIVSGNTWNAGTHTLSATYAGDAANTPAVATPVSQQIDVAQAVLTLSTSKDPAALGDFVTFSAFASSPGVPPAGAVEFFDGSTRLGTGTLNAGTASLSLATLSLGQHTISARYAGDQWTAAASAPALSQVIQPTLVTVALTSSAGSTLFGSKIAFSTHVVGTGAQPAGSVDLAEGGSVLATVKLDSKGIGTFILDDLSIGTHTLTAAYSGDATHDPANSPALSQQVLQVTATRLSLSAAHVTAGLPFQVSVQVSATTGKPITGSLTLADNGSVITSATIDSAGQMTWSSASLAVGVHNFTADYVGDAVNAASNSQSSSSTVEAAISTTAFTTSQNPAVAGSPLTLSASVLSNGATPTGSINFMDGANVLTTQPLSPGGTAAYTTSALLPGSHLLSAVYSGDANTTGSASAAVPQQVAQKTTVSLVPAANPALLGDSIALTVAVSNGVPATPPTGTVTLMDGGIIIAVLPLANSAATFAWSGATAGSHALIATYSGDAKNSGTVSSLTTMVVTLRPSSTSLTTTPTTLSAGQSLVLISGVLAQGGALPTGTIAFLSGSETLGTAKLTSSGIVSLSLTPRQNVYFIRAVYSGDALYASSSSSDVTVTVNPTVEFTMDARPGNISLKSGEHTTLTVALTTAATFNDTIALGCAGLPAYATCTWSENQVAVGSGLPHTLTVVIDTGTPLGAGLSSAGLAARGWASVTLGLIVLLSVTRKRLAVRPFLVLLLGITLLGGVTGCGSVFTQQHTPVGDYTFLLIGTGHTTGATQKTTIQMKVTQ